MTAKEVGAKIWGFISKLWTTKVGKIILVIVAAVAIAVPSGGIGKIWGCVSQKKITKAVEEQLDDAKKAQKEMQKQLILKDEEIKKLQAEVDKLDKKKKKK